MEGNAGTEEHRGWLVLASAASLFLWAWLGALGWGSWSGLFANPARAGCIATAFVGGIVALFTGVNLSSGVREDRANRWIFLPTVVAWLALAWLMPYLDRRGLLAIDGEVTRYVGLVLFVAGCVLRIWPMFVLGRRFSGLVAIQPGHELVTDGPYKIVRHPSYAGMVLGLFGWALVFRSVVGVVAAILGIGVLIARIDAEEALLASQFGTAYADYRRRTWRLVPWIY